MLRNLDDSMSSGFSKYDRKPITQSLYCYPGTEVLINKENIRDAKALADYEADITIIRQYELEAALVVRGKFGKTHLQRIQDTRGLSPCVRKRSCLKVRFNLELC